MDHVDCPPRCNAISYLSAWHMTEVQYGCQQDTVAVCHGNSFDPKLRLIDLVWLIAVWNAIKTEKTTSTKSIVQSMWRADDTQKWSNVIFSSINCMDFFVFWKIHCFHFGQNFHPVLECWFHAHMMIFATFFAYTLNQNQPFDRWIIFVQFPAVWTVWRYSLNNARQIVTTSSIITNWTLLFPNNLDE